jgi:GH24 family phage-related lysozyme (muramidase)
MDFQKLAQQLRLHEGYRSKVYLDTVGHPTVGIGFNLDRDDAEVRLRSVGANYHDVVTGKYELSKDQAKELLKYDVEKAESDARRLVFVYDELNDVRQRVIVDMVYNLGAYGFSKFKNTIRHICNGDYEKASDNMLKSKWARQVKGRAKVLANMMKYGEDVYEL